MSSLSQDLLYSIFSLNADLDEYYTLQELQEGGCHNHPVLYDDEDTGNGEAQHKPSGHSPSSPPIQMPARQSRREFLFCHPLSVLRRASQVCSLWRGIVFSAPLLWGQLIDIDVLFVSHRDWPAEVLSRTEDALLHVRARGGAHRLLPHDLLYNNKNLDLLSRYLNFTARIVEQNWPRIRKLDVYFDRWMGLCADEFRDRMDVIKQPAHVLEYFNLKIADTKIEFTHSAGRLRHFHAFSNITFSIHAPWVATLHTLELAKSAPPWSISEFIAILQMMQCLEKLSLGVAWKDVENDLATTLPRTKLPRLDNISLWDMSAAGCAVVLETLVPTHVRHFYTRTSYPQSEAEIRAFRNVIQAFALDRQFGKYLTLRVFFTDGQFEFSDSDKDPAPNTSFQLSVQHHIGVSHTNVPPRMRDEFMEDLFRIFAQGDFNHTCYLTLGAGFTALGPRVPNHARVELLNAVRLLFHALDRVTVVSLPGYVITVLHTLSRREVPNEGPILPSLRRLVLRNWWEEFPAAARAFYAARGQEGHAPPCLDIGVNYLSNDMSSLNDISGLQLLSSSSMIYLSQSAERRCLPPDIFGLSGALSIRPTVARHREMGHLLRNFASHSFARSEEDSEELQSTSISWSSTVRSALPMCGDTLQCNIRTVSHSSESIRPFLTRFSTNQPPSTKMSSIASFFSSFISTTHADSEEKAADDAEVVVEEQAEEEEPEDLHPVIRDECKVSAKCAALTKHFEHCQEKVSAGEGFKGEDCVEELCALMLSCVASCY
ncbi:hypothetical protein NLJ89_g3929 [Agrocybe chaxingu]|uniref:Ubiquinol-cytochrome C reductase hinge domain-containing protein n=1 Tax=Agrocybe chaxingu TaxID=84603 RepID=A0A9W8K3U1_9AGAR|nr:hypothetical protein NLJ89_g3929 [Agrocybe chaxingu]